MIFCRSVPNGDVSILVFVFCFLFFVFSSRPQHGKTPCFLSTMGISPSLLLLSLPDDMAFTDRLKVRAWSDFMHSCRLPPVALWTFFAFWHVLTLSPSLLGKWPTSSFTTAICHLCWIFYLQSEVLMVMSHLRPQWTRRCWDSLSKVWLRHWHGKMWLKILSFLLRKTSSWICNSSMVRGKPR